MFGSNYQIKNSIFTFIATSFYTFDHMNNLYGKLNGCKYNFAIYQQNKIEFII